MIGIVYVNEIGRLYLLYGHRCLPLPGIYIYPPVDRVSENESKMHGCIQINKINENIEIINTNICRLVHTIGIIRICCYMFNPNYTYYINNKSL